MLAWAEDGDRYKGEAELVARTIQVCSKDCCLEAAEDNFGYSHLLETTNRICHQLGHLSLLSYEHNNSQVFIYDFTILGYFYLSVTND